MNFLAHALLAGADEADRVGGVMGDFVKGILPAGLPADLASGVALHRAIDGFAEQHPAFVASRRRISPLRRRVSGVLVDLFYDHLLARDWTEYGPGNLESYVVELYASLNSRMGVLSERAQAIGLLMQQENWLCSYRDVARVGLVVDRMAVHRLRYANTLAGGIEEFLADPAGFDADFRQFLPDAVAFAAGWRADRPLRGG